MFSICFSCLLKCDGRFHFVPLRCHSNQDKPLQLDPNSIRLQWLTKYTSILYLNHLMSQQQQKVSLDSLPPQQILQIKQQFQQDIKSLSQSMGQLRYAYERYQESRSTIKMSANSTKDDQILIPLSSSLYIPGYMDNERDGKKYFMIEYGTGYFVERETKDAMDFCERKSKMVKEKMEKLFGVINEKKVMLEKCNMVLMNVMAKQEEK